MTLALTGVLVQPAHGGFQVSPTRFEFSLHKRFTNFFTLTNTGEQSARIRVYARFVEVGEQNQIIEKVGHPHDLSRWVVFNPRQLSIRPKQKRVVRFSVRPPRGLENGEYRGVIFFEELPAQVAPTAADANAGALSLNLRLLTRLGVTLYGMKGEPHPELKVGESAVNVDQTGLVVQTSLENTGNVHVNLILKAQLLDESGNQVFQSRNSVLLQRKQSRRWEFKSKRPPAGKYRLVAVGTNKKVAMLELDLPIEVEAAQKN